VFKEVLELLGSQQENMSCSHWIKKEKKERKRSIKRNKEKKENIYNIIIYFKIA